MRSVFVLSGLVCALFLCGCGDEGPVDESTRQITSQDLPPGCHVECPPCPPNKFCIEIACVPVCHPSKCGASTCASDEYCCNESCGICAPAIGGVCPQTVCAPTPTE